MKKFIFFLFLSMQSFFVLASELESLDDYECKNKSETQEQETFISLVSRNGVRYKLSKKSAKLSEVLMNLLDNNPNTKEILMSTVDSQTLEKIIYFVEKKTKNSHSNLDKIFSGYNKAKFLLERNTKNNDFTLLDLTDIYKASHYLGVDFLEKFTATKITSLIVNLNLHLTAEEKQAFIECLNYRLSTHFVPEKLHPKTVLNLLNCDDLDNVFWTDLLERYFPEEYRRSFDFKEEVEGSIGYKVFYYSTNYPVYLLERTVEGNTDFSEFVSFNSDGSKVVTADGRTATIWNLRTGEEICILRGHRNSIKSLSFNRDGSRVVTSSSDKTAKIWNTETGEEIFTVKGHTKSVWSASFNIDSTKIVTASSDNTARIWNSQNGKLLHILEGHTHPVWSANFSPDGSKVVTTSSDNTAMIWNVNTGNLIVTLASHIGYVNSARFSRDGLKVVTASWDNTAKIWDVSTGKLLHTLEGHNEGLKFAKFSRDALRVVTVSCEEITKIWKTLY